MPLTRANARQREREVSSPRGGGGSREGSRFREVALERAGSGRRSRSRGSRASGVNRETSGNVRLVASETRTVGEQRQSREGQGDRRSRSGERSRRTSNRRSRSRSRRRTVSVDNENSRMLKQLKMARLKREILAERRGKMIQLRQSWTLHSRM